MVWWCVLISSISESETEGSQIIHQPRLHRATSLRMLGGHGPSTAGMTASSALTQQRRKTLRRMGPSASTQNSPQKQDMASESILCPPSIARFRDCPNPYMLQRVHKAQVFDLCGFTMYVFKISGMHPGRRTA